MLFNSFSFIFVFLPLTWLAATAAHRLAGMRLEQATICLASLIFYAMWDVRFLPVLLGSIGVNFWLGRRILRAPRAARRPNAGRWLAAGVGFNLLVLGFFKYAYFHRRQSRRRCGARRRPSRRSCCRWRSRS